MMNETLFIILGMALVTYLPRALSVVFFNNLDLPPLINRFLKFIPFAILGALIFPGILKSTGQLPSSIVGGISAFILAWFELNILIVVLGSIILTTFVQII